MHIVIPLHDLNRGGTEIIAFRLARHWMAAGCRVSVLAGARDGTIAVPEGAELVVLEPGRPRSALSRLGLGAAMVPAMQALAPDVIFVPGNFHFILAHAFRRALPGTVIVGKISNPLVPARGTGGRLARLAAPVLRRFLAPFDAIAAMSRGLEQECRAAVPGAPVVTILDPNIPDEVEPPAMRDRRARSGPLRLLALARLEPQKNLALALRTLAELRRHREAILTIAGEGAERAKLEALAHRLGIAGYVDMPGFVSDIAGAFADADMLLVSSYYEGGPATAVEALAHGVPVVSTDCSLLLHDLLASPRLGRLAARSTPGAMAQAVLEQAEAPPASADELREAIAGSRYGAASEAYLALFRRLIYAREAGIRSA